MPCAEAASPRKMLPPPMTMRDLDAERAHLGDLGGDALEVCGLDAEAGVAHQGFAGELEQDALEAGGGLSHGHGRVGDRRRGV